ncbi:CopG family ribbon-helix-helix protein [Pannonibacter phragmitetus]|uniref:CopG family ribbon-helix-helix protein n=1 Tax=Pannonibacter phragmitetus TaxID=121719 RepID=UPI001AD8C824|nr:ribbon-helix-helix protein, CopG family [Pannonibacter phragmitetus]
MPQRPGEEPVTIRTSRVAEIDALANATGRSRNDIVNQAIEQYLDVNMWQMERSEAGIAAMRECGVLPAGNVFAAIAGKHSWDLT